MEGAATTFLAASTDMCMQIAPRKGVRSTDSSLQAVGSHKLLARDAIIRHLQLMNCKHKRCHGPNADVVRLHVLRGNVFQCSGLGESFRYQSSAEWSDLLRHTRPAFVMTNPGWFNVGPPIVRLLTHAMMHQLHQVRSVCGWLDLPWSRASYAQSPSPFPTLERDITVTDLACALPGAECRPHVYGSYSLLKPIMEKG